MIFDDYLGLQAKRIDGGAEVRMKITEQTLNSRGIVHGGVICSLLDQAIGAAVHYTLGLGGRAVTAELKVNFLAPASAGTLIARGRLLREGKRLIVGEAEIVDQDGRLLAKGLGTWAVVE